MRYDFMGTMCEVWLEDAKKKAENDLKQAKANHDTRGVEKAQKEIKECNNYIMAGLIHDSNK